MLQKLDLVLVGRTLLSNYLIHFSGDGWGCAPSLLFGLRPPSPGVCSLYGRVMVFIVGLMATFFRRSYANNTHLPEMLLSEPQSPLQAAVDLQCCLRLPTQASLAPSLMRSQLPSLGPGAHSISFVLPKGLCFPSSGEILESNSTDLQSQMPWG